MFLDPSDTNFSFGGLEADSENAGSLLLPLTLSKSDIEEPNM